jgi:hypothetical protein
MPFLPRVSQSSCSLAVLTRFKVECTDLISTHSICSLMESPLFPGICFYLTMWYKRDELNFRLSLFFSSATLGKPLCVTLSWSESNYRRTILIYIGIDGLAGFNSGCLRRNTGIRDRITWWCWRITSVELAFLAGRCSYGGSRNRRLLDDTRFPRRL